MPDDTPEPSERKRWRCDMGGYGGPSLVWPGALPHVPIVLEAGDLYELLRDETETVGEDEIATAFAALRECVRKAEVYDRIAEIVAQPLPAIRDGATERGLRSVRAVRYQLIASEFPEAD